MSPLIFALALFAADQPAAAAAPEIPTNAADAAYPPGAPRDDYQFVGWCYGALRGYLDLYDQVMPEVTRIETTYRKPGTSLSADLKVYADQQRQGRADLELFRSAMTAAEKASLRPINQLGGDAVRKGRATWNAGPAITKARLAQEWMSWTLPARCQTTATTLKQRAALMGPAFQVSADPEPAPAAPAPASPDAPTATAPVT
jgi:hypothetical protein